MTLADIVIYIINTISTAAFVGGIWIYFDTKKKYPEKTTSGQ